MEDGLLKTTLKQRLAAGEELVGTFVKTPSPMLCEVLALSELDLVCLDAEHSPFDRGSLDQCLHALRCGDMPALVRVPSALPEHSLNALDCGATGIVAPHVKNAEQAAEIAANGHFGAAGRGYAGSTRAAGYSTRSMSEHLSDSASRTVLVAQIEDLEGLEQIDKIAAVDGIDCLFAGRADLTVAMGAKSPAQPEVVKAVEKICAAGRAAARPVGMFLGDLSEIPHWRERGASLFLLSSDHGFLLQGANQLLRQVRAS